jgi:hypothetical protein
LCWYYLFVEKTLEFLKLVLQMQAFII